MSYLSPQPEQSSSEEIELLTALFELPTSGVSQAIRKASASSFENIDINRSDTGDDDTWVGATAALSPAILEFDLHYEIDSLGSDLELTKDAPA